MNVFFAAYYSRFTHEHRLRRVVALKTKTPHKSICRWRTNKEARHEIKVTLCNFCETLNTVKRRTSGHYTRAAGMNSGRSGRLRIQEKRYEHKHSDSAQLLAEGDLVINKIVYD